MAEQISNKGYLMIGEQTDPNTPVVPTVVVPLYEEDITTDMNVDEDAPIIGSRAARSYIHPGQRIHGGSITVMAEPNTSLHLFSMMLKRGNASGGGPYTWLLTPDDSKSYVLDFLKGRHVFRYGGAKAHTIAPDWDDNKMVYEIDISAMWAFTFREVQSVSGSGPYTITLKTNYDLQPTKGLVVGDLIQLYDVSTGSYINAEVDALTDTTITVSENVAAGTAGDIISIRPRTPSVSIQQPFLWSRTFFHFGADATAAMAAAHTPLEQGSAWELAFNVNEEDGEHRSGSADPASIIQTLADATVTAQTYFDDPLKQNKFMTLAKNACVIRHYSESGYELRVTIYDMRPTESELPLETEEVLYDEQEYMAKEDQVTGKIYEVTIINNVASV